MFEQAEARAVRRAEERVAARIAQIAGQEMPGGVSAEVVAGGVRLSGRRLRLRFVTDPAVRAVLP